MSLRERILEATAQVAGDEGPSHVTLDRVAEVAGVSKGGLLYHFSTKDELLGGLIEREADKFEAAVEDLVREGMPFIDAYVEVTCETHRTLARVAPALIAAAAVNKDLLKPFRERCEEWNHRLSPYGVTPEGAQAAMMLGDGLLVGTALGLVETTEADMRALKARMRWLLRPRYEEELAETARYALGHADEEEPVPV